MQWHHNGEQIQLLYSQEVKEQITLLGLFYEKLDNTNISNSIYHLSVTDTPNYTHPGLFSNLENQQNNLISRNEDLPQLS